MAQPGAGPGALDDYSAAIVRLRASPNATSGALAPVSRRRALRCKAANFRVRRKPFPIRFLIGYT